MPRDKIITQLMKWHRRIGLFMVAVLLIVIATGFLMNHSRHLELDTINITNSPLLKWYGLDNSEQPTGYQVQPGIWLTAHNDNLHINQQPIGRCVAPLFGAISYNNLFIALCQNQLLLLTPDGTLIESITPALGLPGNSRGIGLADGNLILDTTTGAINFDIDSLSSIPANPESIKWASPHSLPQTISQALSPTGISLEKLVQDIHSGRVLGTMGIFLVDLSGFFLLVLTLTGLWTWLRHRKITGKNNP